MDPRTTRCVPTRSPLRALRVARGPRSLTQMRCVHVGGATPQQRASQDDQDRNDQEE